MSETNFLPGPNFYRVRQLAEDVFLMTVDSGEWQLLSTADYDRLKRREWSDPNFRRTLEESHLYLTMENYPAYLQKISARWQGIFMPPSLHIVVVTPQCNLRCIYCHAGLDQNKHECMTEKTASSVLDKILETPLENLTLEIQGGEPMLNFEVIKFLIDEGKLRALRKGKNLEFCIVTNFTDLLSDEKIRFLINHEVSVSTSIDGDTTIHENNRNRNYPGGFAVLSERVATFRNIWHDLRDDEPQLSAMVTTTAPALKKSHEVVDAYLSLGFSNLFVRPVNPFGRGDCGLPDLSYSAEEFVTFWSEMIDYILELWKTGKKISESHLDILLKKIFLYDNGYMDLRFPCGAAFGQRAYNFDGKIFTCDEGRMLQSESFCIGNTQDNTSLINRSSHGLETFISSLSELSYCEYCAYKPFCGVCPIMNWKQTGNIHTSIYNTRRCKIYRGMLDYVFRKFMTDKAAQGIFSDMVISEIEQ